MPHEFRFTKQSIQKLPAPGPGKRIEYRDTETRGLRLRKPTRRSTSTVDAAPSGDRSAYASGDSR